MAHHDFVAGLMHTFFKLEISTLARFFQSPSSKDSCCFGDIFLCVAAIYAQRVQFHQLAAIVLVQSTAFSFGLLLRPRRTWEALAPPSPSRLSANSVGRI